MIEINSRLTPLDLVPAIENMWEASARSIRNLESEWKPDQGAPVFTVQGKYTARGWTEWTQGFQFGSYFLQFDATGDESFLETGRRFTAELMAPHVSHIGVHDHGFNNISTYGALRRLMLEKRIPHNADAMNFYEMALKVSGAVQASRWTNTADGDGFIYSFNGPHSLFCDTIRSLRSLAVAHLLGHRLMAENDISISLLDRLIQHARTTSNYSVYFGEGRDLYDVTGRVAHESLFNTNDGNYRAPSTQQGYSPWSTWTRGAAWIITGYAEQLEFLDAVSGAELEPFGGRAEIEKLFFDTCKVACDYYLDETPSDGIPYWDTGAPGLQQMGDYRSRPAEPQNDYEPVDSSAAAIAAQGFLRLGRYMSLKGEMQGLKYFQAGMTIIQTLLSETYLNQNPQHQGLLLHSVYHRPRGWDYIPPGSTIPYGESCMWGDYHLREAVLLLQRISNDDLYYTFFGPQVSAS